jgi:hypothetical protein
MHRRFFSFSRLKVQIMSTKKIYFSFVAQPCFLFSLYLNNLETFLEKNNVTGLKTLSDELEHELGVSSKACKR